MKKVILITGATSGFGLQLANQLHNKGYVVIGTSRNPEKSKVPFKLLSLDISNEKSIQDFKNELFKNVKSLDVLVNNAGYMLTGLAEETSLEQGKQQFETNFWGTISLTNALLPHFRSKKSGQIITISSIMGLIGLPGKSMYSASKHALEGYFKALRFELNPFNINVNMVEPMWSKTNIGNNSINISNKIQEYNILRSKVDNYFKKSLENAEQPRLVVNTIEKLIVTNSNKFRNPVGKMSSMIFFLQNYAYRMFEGAIHKDIDKA